MKLCRKCQTEKADAEFYSTVTHGRPRLATYCRPCYRQYQKEARANRLVGERREQDQKRQAAYSRSPAGRFFASRSVARRRGLEWGLTIDLFTQLVSRPCAYCTGPLNPTGAGLDRKDSSVGYQPGNVVPCCRTCNVVKSDIFTHEEMLLLGKVIRGILDRRPKPNGDT